MRSRSNLALAIIAGGMLYAQDGRQDLFAQFQASRQEPSRAYQIGKCYLESYDDGAGQAAEVRRWVQAYERVASRASQEGVGGYPATLISGYAKMIWQDGNKGHIFLEPLRLVFKGAKGEMSIPKGDIEKVQAYAYSRWSENDTQGFVIHARVNGKKSKIAMYASSEAWVASGDKSGKMADPKPVVEKINAWLQ